MLSHILTVGWTTSGCTTSSTGALVLAAYFVGVGVGASTSKSFKFFGSASSGSEINHNGMAIKVVPLNEAPVIEA